jgi:hypothetical protein
VHLIQSVVLHFCTTMACQKEKKPQTNDNPWFGPARCNTVARCNLVYIIETNCIAEGTSSHSFSNEADEDDILVPDLISIAYCSHSDSPLCNNQPIPTFIITKPCPSNQEILLLKILLALVDCQWTTIKVDNFVYVIYCDTLPHVLLGHSDKPISLLSIISSYWPIHDRWRRGGDSKTPCGFAFPAELFPSRHPLNGQPAHHWSHHSLSLSLSLSLSRVPAANHPGDAS